MRERSDGEISTEVALLTKGYTQLEDEHRIIIRLLMIDIEILLNVRSKK